jgi:hypothetical protein
MSEGNRIWTQSRRALTKKLSKFLPAIFLPAIILPAIIDQQRAA